MIFFSKYDLFRHSSMAIEIQFIFCTKTAMKIYIIFMQIISGQNQFILVISIWIDYSWMYIKWLHLPFACDEHAVCIMIDWNRTHNYHGWVKINFWNQLRILRPNIFVVLWCNLVHNYFSLINDASDDTSSIAMPYIPWYMHRILSCFVLLWTWCPLLWIYVIFTQNIF